MSMDRQSPPPDVFRRAWQSLTHAPRWQWFIAASVFFGLFAWAVHFTFWRGQLKRFQVVRAGVLYRTGQPSEFGLDSLVSQFHVKTVLSLQLFDCRLHQDWLDPGKANGAMESIYVKDLGIQHLQWPMGEEGFWPWLTPWQFEEFFRLLDDPAQHPIAVHCMGGRHRTGTFSALFRLEYDRWPVERVLDEMYSFNFGLPVPIQEHNLRTYAPRPHPDEREFQALKASFAALVDASAAKDYETFVWALSRRRHELPLRAAIEDYVRQRRPFALALAQRLITATDDVLVPAAVAYANDLLPVDQATAHDWSSAAALIADYGAAADQVTLVKALEAEIKLPQVTPRYAALAAGVTNRYTPNRLPFLRPLLEDERLRPEPAAAKYRYCETAVARIASITDQEFFFCQPDRKIWDDSRVAARYWYEHHPEATHLTMLLPASGKNMVRVGTGSEKEDLSRMRR